MSIPRPVLTPSAEDGRWLERAAELGRRGWGRVHPNPLVGCVLVRDGGVVAEGWHEEYGGPHAEVNALVQAGEAASGATAFVSLEPCDHHGQTPPCSEGLIAAGVSRVVYGAADPGDRSSGGHERLSAHGIEVVGPCFDQRRAFHENPAFFRRAAGLGPYLVLKLASTSDGMIAAAPGERTAITGSHTSEEVQRLRAGFDSIMVGSGTAVVDDPLLTVRGPLQPRVPPARVILDATGRLSAGARLFSNPSRVIVVTSPRAPAAWVKSLRDRGALVRIVTGREDTPGMGVDLPQAIAALADDGVGSVLCEGGGRLAASLMEADLVQRFYLFRSPHAQGETGVFALETKDRTAPWLQAADEATAMPGWRLIDTAAFGEDRLSVWSREAER